MKVVVDQWGSTPLDLEGNCRSLLLRCETLSASGADIIVFPELSSSGYVLERHALLDVAVTRSGPFFEALGEAARESETVIVAGIAERDGDHLFNSAVVFDADGSLCLLYRKLHLFGDEKLCFDPGDRGLPVADTAYGRIGAAICYDLRFPEVVRILALQGAELIVVPTAWVGGFGRTPAAGEVSEQALGAMLQANLNQVYMACASQAGTPAAHTFLGNSLVADPYGQPLAAPLGANIEGSAHADVDVSEVVIAQRRSEVVTPRADRRTDVYRLCYAGLEL